MRPFSLVLAAVFTATCALPSMAAELDPSGHWQVTTGESRYAVARCGDAGRELCARLVWLRDDARTDENLALLNKTVVRGAPVDENEWTGTVVFEGKTYDATVTLVSSDAMKVHSCSGVFCQSFRLQRL
jgi:uncharacterized protein (DUF2147 family)